MDFRHGQYLNFASGKTGTRNTSNDRSVPANKPPLANAYLTVLQKCGLEVESFADSTGGMSELLK